MLYRKHVLPVGQFASIGHATDVGRVRKHNEDALRVNADATLLVVADGMGGHAAGEVASRLTVDTVESAVSIEGLGLRDAVAPTEGSSRPYGAAALPGFPLLERLLQPHDPRTLCASEIHRVPIVGVVLSARNGWARSFIPKAATPPAA